MKIRFTVIAAAAFCFATLLGQATAGVIIDFDTVPGGAALPNNSVLSNQYASLGITFSGFENGGAVSQPIATTQFSSEFGGSPVSGQVLENRDVNNSRGDIIVFDFAGSTSGIEFDFIPFGTSGPATQIEAFDSNGNSIYNSTIGGPSGTNVNFHYVLPVAGVFSFEMRQPGDTWVWGLDNLQFNMNPVPEPASLTIFGTICLLGFGRRRKA